TYRPPAKSPNSTRNRTMLRIRLLPGDVVLDSRASTSRVACSVLMLPIPPLHRFCPSSWTSRGLLGDSLPVTDRSDQAREDPGLVRVQLRMPLHAQDGRPAGGLDGQREPAGVPSHHAQVSSHVLDALVM